MKIYLYIVVTSLCSLLATCATDQKVLPVSSQVYERVLDNGFKVLVKPDNRAPVVVCQVWYKVGGSYEPPGLTGISHVLEHMMFKGTATLGPNEFSRIIAEQGGEDNAFTGMDYTAYFQTLEKSRLEISFRLESDRMRNLVLDPDEFAKEIEVVKEERRLDTDDDPESVTYEKFMATAYLRSNYRNPIIGWPQDLDSIGVEDLRAWYDRFYIPNNATLVVVGDVVPEQVFGMAEQYFGPIPRGETPIINNPVEPRQERMRRIKVDVPAKVPYILMGYHVPVISSAENDDAWVPYALDIAAYVLDGGESARLPAELVRTQQIASWVGVDYDPASRNPTLFVIEANPAPGVTLSRLGAALKTQIRRMQDELVTEAELSRVITQLVADKVYAADSGFYQAMQLGMFETNGLSWELGEQKYEHLYAVTPEQVREVIKKYMRDENLTIAVLEVSVED